MTVVIAGERSGVGKTTVTLALLSFLSQKGCRVQSFKVGPDYIDPMFHSAIAGRPCRNLDPLLTSQTYVQSCFDRHCQGADYALVEGVMGLFDGIKKEDNSTTIKDFASTAHIARLLDLPVILVIDCSRLSGSVAAIAHGYRSFDSRIKIAGLILNRVGSDRHLELLKEALQPLKIPILGILRRQQNISIPDRHLGLVPAAEINQVDTIFDRLAQLAKESFNWQKLLPLLQVTNKPFTPSPPHPLTPSPIKIALASDRAFNFYYQDNLDLLEHLGAKLIPWSPLADENLPPQTQGLYFGGGFPEVFASQLTENKSALMSVKQAIKAGMPTYAECGGLMYLCQKIVNFEGEALPMVGILPATAVMSKTLTLGYRRATALGDSLLFTTGETISGHEFHRSQLNSNSQNPLFAIETYQSSAKPTREGWYSLSLHASYIHLHFGQYPSYLQRFLHNCFTFEQTASEKL
ncbi:MAG: cobyrinate a,c-diamide synthase [Prochloraceae cyanobacterium]|nr:cobyrinate a,c-diamide synthase [Prochloraceae cyanobacterium]